jgi:hypothetical protein
MQGTSTKPNMYPIVYFISLDILLCSHLGFN